MAHFTGKDMVLEWGTIDISVTSREITVNEAAASTPDIDVTHKGDTEQQLMDGLPGAPKTTIKQTVLADDASTVIQDLVQNDQDTLSFYPQGKTHGKPEFTLNNAIFLNRDYREPYNEPAVWDLNFEAKEGGTWSTYSSV